MAERTPNRKSDRNFNLGKGGQHTFDLEKKTTRKFELDKEDEQITGVPLGESTTDDRTGSSISKKWILGTSIVIIVALLITFFCIRSCDRDTAPTPQETQVEGPTQPINDVSTDGENAADIDVASAPSSDATESTDDLVGDETKGGSSSYHTGEEQAQKPINEPTTQPQNATASTSASSDIEEEALNVIRGVYGNAPVRYDLLKQKGLDPAVIQKRVNEMKRQGVF